MTPQSSPFQQHANFQSNIRDLQRNDSPKEIEGTGIHVGERGFGGEPPLASKPYQQNSNINQPTSHQEQQAAFERILRPLLPRTRELELSDSFSSPHNTADNPVNTSQPHGTTNARNQQISHARDQHIQSPAPYNFPHIQSLPDLSWLSHGESSDQNTYILPHPLPNRWMQAREYRRRVHELPYHDTRSDSTIREVEHDAEFWVRQLILAMTNVTNVKDTGNSHAKRLFVPNSYDPLLIECTCRQIFTSLLDRCISGFRGPAQFNKALKPGKDCEADLTGTCKERMRKVVNALMWNKRVCKDVLYEDWKILLLVNHPLAYDKEKDCQKGSNDQRRERQVREREKLKRTEEELLVYRRGQQQLANLTYYDTAVGSYPFLSSKVWAGDQIVDRRATAEGPSQESKRARVEDEEDNMNGLIDSKRQRLR